MLNIYIAHENGTYFANPIVYKCVYVDGGGGGSGAQWATAIKNVKKPPGEKGQTFRKKKCYLDPK